MNTYIISSEYHKREIVKRADSIQEVKDWIIAHLDMSGDDWKITKSDISL